MYNCIKLVPEDVHMECFLWRDLDTTKEPDTNEVLVNNIGVKPTGSIAALALQKSASLFENQYPVTATQWRDKSYVDYIGLTAKNMKSLKSRTS